MQGANLNIIWHLYFRVAESSKSSQKISLASEEQWRGWMLHWISEKIKLQCCNVLQALALILQHFSSCIIRFLSPDWYCTFMSVGEPDHAVQCSGLQWRDVLLSRTAGGVAGTLVVSTAVLRLLLSCLKLLWLLHWTWPTSCLNCCTSSLLHLTQLFIVNCTCSTQAATCIELQVGGWGGIQLSESGGHVLHCGLHCSAWHHWICWWWCYVIHLHITVHCAINVLSHCSVPLIWIYWWCYLLHWKV